MKYFIEWTKIITLSMAIYVAVWTGLISDECDPDEAL